LGVTDPLDTKETFSEAFFETLHSAMDQGWSVPMNEGAQENEGGIAKEKKLNKRRELSYIHNTTCDMCNARSACVMEQHRHIGTTDGGRENKIINNKIFLIFIEFC
jgi:hypothetical protein